MMINDCESTQNLEKIRNISTLVRILVVIGTMLFVVVEMLGQVSVEFSNKAPTSFESGTTSRSISYILSRLPYQLSVLGSFYWAFQLFGGFRKGDIFTGFSVKAFRLLSVCVILIGVNSLLFGIYKGVLDLIFSGGQTVHFDIGLDGHEFLMVGFGLFLYAIALVQREAKMRTEDLKLIF